MGSKPRTFVYFLSICLSLLIIAIAVVEALYFWHVRPKLNSNRAQQRRYLQTYLADLDHIKDFELLLSVINRREGKSDAGEALNKKVHWNPTLDSGLAIKSYGAEKPLVAPETREQLWRLKGEWISRHARVRNMKADLSLFVDLGQFDFWNIETASPIAELADKRLFIPPNRLPIPDVQDLLALAKIRLMRAADGEVGDLGNRLSALSDVRDLARLLFTTENLQLVLTGLSLLEIENTAYDFFVSNSHIPKAAWIPIAPSLLQAAQRSLQGTVALLRLWTEQDILGQVYLGASPPLGLCAAANDSLLSELALRSRLEPQWPLEIDLRSEYATLDAIYRRSRSICRLHYLGELVSHDALQLPIPGPFVLSRLPWSRKVFALHRSVFDFHGLQIYSPKQSANF